MSIEQSSQFASALLLCAKPGNWRVKVVGENAEESPYVAMTAKMSAEFAGTALFFQIEPDASSASYFLAANEMGPITEFKKYSEQFGIEVDTSIRSAIGIINRPDSELQVDANFFDVLHLGANSRAIRKKMDKIDPKGRPAAIQEMLGQLLASAPISRKNVLGDSIMTAIVMSAIVPFPSGRNMEGMTRFTDLGRLRLQETERVFALAYRA